MDDGKKRTKQEVNRREATETLLKELGEVGGIEMFELVGGSRESPCFPLSFGRQSRDTLCSSSPQNECITLLGDRWMQLRLSHH